MGLATDAEPVGMPWSPRVPAVGPSWRLRAAVTALAVGAAGLCFAIADFGGSVSAALVFALVSLAGPVESVMLIRALRADHSGRRVVRAGAWMLALIALVPLAITIYITYLSASLAQSLS